MENKDSLEVAMTLIMYGGEAKSCAIEAIAAAKKQDFDRAQERLSQAQKALQAHHAQAEMLSKEAQGEKTELSLFMVHGQDHLMTSIAFVDLAKEIVDLHKKFDE